MENEIAKLNHRCKNYIDLEIEKIKKDFNEKLEQKREILYADVKTICNSYLK